MTDPHAAIAAVFRIELPRLVAGLARVTHDVGRAEELAQDAMVVALERWPADGVPDNPGAWLMTTAKRRALDDVRRTRMADTKHEQIARDHDPRDVAGELADALDDDVGDDLLRLVFTACHPVLPTEARVALTLRLVGGLTTAEIARAYLVPEPTIGQRISRAKKTLADAKVPFEVPRGAERAERLESVLAVIYLVFNEGHTATAGANLTRPELCHDALRIARVLAGLAPDEPEVHGLVALLELTASRLAARIDRDGVPVLLRDQDRSLWDRVLIRRGLAALARAEQLVAARTGDSPASSPRATSGRDEPAARAGAGPAGSSRATSGRDEPAARAGAGPAGSPRATSGRIDEPAARAGAGPAGSSRATSARDEPAAPAGSDEAVAARIGAGPYQLQAAIAAYHARAATAEATDWARIAATYTLLAHRMPSPVVELNRAYAIAMAFGAEAGLELVDALVAEGALAGYHLLPAVRGDLLAMLGRTDEARAEFQRAAELTRNERERDVLLARAKPS